MKLLSLVLLSLAVAAQTPVTVESLRRLAAGGEVREELVTAVREHPDTLRLALERTFAFATEGDAEEADAAEMVIARSLAEAYSEAWDDPFFVGLVASFDRWSPQDRRAKVEADSLRRAGVEALGVEGLSAARELWRASLEREPSPDSSGRAASLVAVGAGFEGARRLDSAMVYLSRAVRMARSVGDVRTLGNAIGLQANVRKDQGNRAAAAELYAEASKIRVRSGDERGIAADQSNLGLIALDLGDLREARRAFEKALALNQAAGRSRPAAINLTNLADAASLAGDDERAATLYRQALELNTRSGDRAETAFPLHRLGVLAMRRGDYAEARSLLERALAVDEKAGAEIEAIGVRRDLAALETAVGDIESALATLRRAERDAAALPGGASVLHASLVLVRADLYVQLGQLAEAERAYESAERLYRAAGDDGGLGGAQQGRGLLLALRADYTQALDVLDLAAAAQTRAGDLRAAALTRLLIGHVQGEAGDTAAARATIIGAREDLHGLNDVVAEAAALLEQGDLVAGTGATLAAESLYRQGIERLGDVPASDVRWRLHAALGKALRSRGALVAAAEELRTAVDMIETVVGGIRIEERRVGFLADKWTTYGSLALVERRRGRVADAFGVSEQLRARQLRDMLARGRVQARSEVSEREQDLRRRITGLTQVIEAAGHDVDGQREPGVTSPAVNVAREALAASQDAYEALLLELRERDPAYAELVSGEPVSWQAVADRLRPDQALLEYLVTDSASVLFVVTSDTVTAVDLEVGRSVLAGLVEFVRRAMAPAGRSPASGLWRAPLRRLYGYLIGPAERAGLLNGKRSLVIIPHGELNFLPFAALMDDGVTDEFLVQRYELSRAPSATAWVRLADRVQNVPSSGVLALAPRTGTLPASREEVMGIRDVYGADAKVLMGASATERALREDARNYSIVHLATYGVLNKHNPLFSFVQLAADGADDGRLEVHEAFGLPLSGQLVVLSACQTGVASGAMMDIPPGDDWVGLVQAFQYAGARGVVASLWPVEDRATARLMQRFYRRLSEGRTEAAALAEAQRALLRDPHTAHPFYWAGFVRSGPGS